MIDLTTENHSIFRNEQSFYNDNSPLLGGALAGKNLSDNQLNQTEDDPVNKEEFEDMNNKEAADDADLEISRAPTDRWGSGPVRRGKDRLQSETRPEQDITTLEEPGHGDVHLEARASAHGPLEDVVCLLGDVSASNQDDGAKNSSENVDIEVEVGEELALSHKNCLDSIKSQDKMVAGPGLVLGPPVEDSDWLRALMPHAGSNPSHHFLITLGPLLRSKCSRPGRRRLAL